MALMQITVIPMGTGETGVSAYIAEIERFLQVKGVEHSLHDMGTIVAGTTSELFALAHEIHRLPFTKGAKRVITHVTIDERTDADRTLGEKKQSVLRRLQDTDQ